MIKAKFIKASQTKCNKMGSKVIHSTTKCNSCNQCCLWPSSKLSQEAENFIPKDVPKGHMAVYVGQDHKRFVVMITLLKHPLFMALLDQVRDRYGDSTTPTKLWIPCDETVFLHVLHGTRKPGLGQRIMNFFYLC